MIEAKADGLDRDADCLGHVLGTDDLARVAALGVDRPDPAPEVPSAVARACVVAEDEEDRAAVAGDPHPADVDVRQQQQLAGAARAGDAQLYPVGRDDGLAVVTEIDQCLAVAQRLVRVDLGQPRPVGIEGEDAGRPVDRGVLAHDEAAEGGAGTVPAEDGEREPAALLGERGDLVVNQEVGFEPILGRRGRWNARREDDDG